jgi:hypothetical protein
MHLLELRYGPLRLIYLQAGPRAVVRRRVPWYRGSRFYVIVFADQRSAVPLRDQEREAARRRR